SHNREDSAETALCCKKDIPAVNFIIHEIHCRRNIEMCPYCSDSIPKSEMKNHIESEHVQVRDISALGLLLPLGMLLMGSLCSRSPASAG
uniref:TRAD1 protein n=1 Tax=Zonotrichia albicollis TaxID=44394 RepID=A0A8D2M8E8_ZONAL